ncbi:MAG: hypothetical protein HYV33_04815 [Candidatus Kerfeldbacteria bacterium]|nr:hypothetical protein [Candidatus Kerfeldbacteria bacterium]
MCFSATASFVTSGALAITGSATLAKKPTRQLRWLAVIPLLFALQQTIEGLQWLAPKPSVLSTVLGYAFLLFAFLLWPSYLPLAVLSGLIYCEVWNYTPLKK